MPFISKACIRSLVKEKMKKRNAEMFQMTILHLWLNRLKTLEMFN